METNDLIHKLSSLIQLDIDAVHAYRQAIEKIDVVSVKDQLVRFQADHERHVENLSEVVRTMGGEPPAFSKDFKGFLIQGFTALRSITGTEGALKAMRTNERLTNSTYDEATSWDTSGKVRELIQRNREDEQRHLNFIEQAIESRVWEQGKQVA